MGIKVDLHNHSRHGSPDAMSSYDEIAEECAAKALDIVLITEHDKTTDPEVLAKISKKHSILFLPGVELSYPFWGHFIVLGGESILQIKEIRTYDKQVVLEMFSRAEERIEDIPSDNLTFNNFAEAMKEISNFFKDINRFNPLELCHAAKSHGAYVVWAHPFVGTPLRKELDQYLSNNENLDMQDFVLHLKSSNPQIIDIVGAVDALESFNGKEIGLTSFLASSFAQTLNKPTTAGSDGHREWEYGTSYMEIACDQDAIRDVPTLIYALKTCYRTMHWYQ